MATKRILILDDEPALRQTLATELGAVGYETCQLESKRDAYDRLFTWRPDMIITDIKSADMDGWQFLKWVRANRFAARVRLLVMSGLGGPRYTTKALKLGAHYFVNKPFDLARFLETIRRQFAKQERPVWNLPAVWHDLMRMGPLHSLPWNMLADRWLEALRCSPYRTGVIGMADWRLDFVVDDGLSLTVGRLCRPTDPTICYSACRYHSFVDGYGVDKGLIYIVGPRTNHLQNSPRVVIASPRETEEIFAGGIFAPDLKRFET